MVNDSNIIWVTLALLLAGAGAFVWAIRQIDSSESTRVMFTILIGPLLGFGATLYVMSLFGCFSW